MTLRFLMTRHVVLALTQVEKRCEEPTGVVASAGDGKEMG